MVIETDHLMRRSEKMSAKIGIINTKLQEASFRQQENHASIRLQKQEFEHFVKHAYLPLKERLDDVDRRQRRMLEVVTKQRVYFSVLIAVMGAVSGLVGPLILKLLQ